MWLTPFDIWGDMSNFLAEFGLIILAIIAMFVGMLYGLAYFSRYIEYMKMRESRYFDEKVLNTINKAVHVIVIFIVVMLSLLFIQTRSEWVRGILVTFFAFFRSILIGIIILFAFYVLAKILSRLTSSLRRRVGKEEEKIESSQFLNLTEIFFKYSIYTLGILFAIFGGLAYAPSQEIQDGVYNTIFKPIADHWISFVYVVIALVVAYIFYMFVDSLLEDIKKRSKKFSPRVIDVFRSISKYLFIVITASVVALILLRIAVSEIETSVIAIAVTVVAAAVLVLLSAPIRNALSGIVLMMADPFDEGDRVKILDNLVCDVLEMNLTLTMVRSLKGEVISIPNGEIMSKSIVNFSRSGSYAMTVEVSVSYKVPHRQVEEILMAAADKTNGISANPGPEVYSKDVEGNTITYQLLAYIDHPLDMKKIKSDLVCNVQDMFHEKGITVLFPD